MLELYPQFQTSSFKNYEYFTTDQQPYSKSFWRYMINMYVQCTLYTVQSDA